MLGMTRLASSLLLTLSFGLWAVAQAVAGDDDTGLKNTLALQTAMGHARHYLADNAPKKAVNTLEEQLGRVNGNRTFLLLLADAYRAYIKELWLSHQDAEARRFLERLTILDPGAATDPALQRRAEPPPQRVEAPPVEPKPAAIFPNFKLHNPFARKAEEPVKPATVRAKIDDGEDPFDLKLRRQAPSASRAGDLLARADEEFGRKRYAEARLYYEQAYQAEPESVAGCRDRWAYCMLSHVVEQLNQPGLAGRAPAELQQQLQSAVTLAPQLADTARRLQGELDSRKGVSRPPQVSSAATCAYQHLGRNPEGWQVTETAYFRIFHQRDTQFAERVAEIAERTRLEMSRKWFGSDGATWQPKCELILHPTSDSYTKMTGVPGTSPGHSRIESDPSGQRVVGRRLDLRLDNPGALEGVLPHEATHVVLAGQFGAFAVPRWADEGIAVLSEPVEKIEAHRRNLHKCQSEGTLFGCRELMELQNYPAPRRIAAFYAQSVALVEFLSALKGPPAFTEFVRDALRVGYESALRKHYGWDFTQLEQQWQQQVLAASRVAVGSSR
jgi:tetratricopeptide (TPR) repeat protein